MTDNNRSGSTRREFVIGGSAAMLLVAGRSVAGEVMQVIHGTNQGAMPILSVGYWDGLIRGAGDETRVASGVSELERIRTMTTDSSALLTLGPSGNPLALRRGFYIVALREKDVEEIPDWSRIQIAQLRPTDRVQPDGEGVLTGDGSPV